MKRLLISLTLVIAILSLTGAYPASNETTLGDNFSAAKNLHSFPGTKDIKKEFDVKKGQLLSVELDAGGSIKIKSWDKEVVEVNVSISGSDAEDVEVEFEQNSSGIKIYADYEGSHRNRSSNIRFEIMVPKQFDVDFETTGGSVSIDGVEGTLEGKTMGGSLNLSNLKAKINMSTMGGSIELTDSELDGKVKTMGGSISLENLTGDVDAETMGGSIDQKNVKGRKGADGKALNLKTMGGSIRVDDVPNGAYLKTMGGNISVKSAGKFLEVETMGGEIEVDAIDGSIKGKTMGGDVFVTMIGDPAKGDRDVSLTSMGGDIELTVPKGLSMDVDIEIEYTRDYEDDVEIISFFDIKKENSDNWKYSHGNKSKILYGTATVGDGKNKIRIRTINGVVKLKELN